MSPKAFVHVSTACVVERSRLCLPQHLSIVTYLKSLVFSRQKTQGHRGREIPGLGDKEPSCLVGLSL